MSASERALIERWFQAELISMLEHQWETSLEKRLHTSISTLQCSTLIMLCTNLHMGGVAPNYALTFCTYGKWGQLLLLLLLLLLWRIANRLDIWEHVNHYATSATSPISRLLRVWSVHWPKFWDRFAHANRGLCNTFTSFSAWTHFEQLCNQNIRCLVQDLEHTNDLSTLSTTRDIHFWRASF